MCKILMSINPEHVENILAGKKTYEYRKIKCNRKVDSIIIYSTYPVMKVVAEVEVKELICDTPKNLWKKTRSGSGIKKSFFDKYYIDKKVAYAFSLGKVNAFKKSLDLSDFSVKYAPQSFIYIN